MGLLNLSFFSRNARTEVGVGGVGGGGGGRGAVRRESACMSGMWGLYNQN